MNIVKLVNDVLKNYESTTYDGLILISKDDLQKEIESHINQYEQAKQVKQFLEPEKVKEILNNSKGRFMSVIVEKKDGSEREFSFQACKDNAPVFKYHEDLVSIHENGKGFKSFNIKKVKQITFDKQTLKAS